MQYKVNNLLFPTYAQARAYADNFYREYGYIALIAATT